MWVGVPYRALTICKNVVAPLAFCLTLAAIALNPAIWMVPPTPYHQAALSPFWYVAVLLVNSVADHVHADT